MNQLAPPIDANYCRVQFFMTGAGVTISEIHWRAGGATDPTAGLTAGFNLAQFRAAMLPTGCNITEVRASLENVYRDSLVSTNTLQYANAAFVAPNSGDDNVGIRFEGGSLYRRIAYMGLVPDDAIVGGQYDPAGNGVYNKALIKYLNALSGTVTNPNTSWGFLVLNKAPGTSPVCNIVSIAQPVAGLSVVVFTDKPHLVPLNGVFRIRGRKDATAAVPLNQLWTATAVTATSVTFQLAEPTVAAFTGGPGGKLQNQVRTFVAYSNAIIDGYRERRRGGRTFLPLGRRKRKATVGY